MAKRNFLSLNETEFNAVKAECVACAKANSAKPMSLSLYGAQFDGLSEDAEFQIRYHLKNKFGGEHSFNTVARFFCNASFSSYQKKVA